MATPAQVDVWAGLDAGKSEHFANVLDDSGERLFARAVRSDQRDLEALLERAGRHGTPGLVIDQPGSIAQLALAVAAQRGVPVAYVPGLVMRRAADLYPGEAKTDRRDACVLADTGRTHRKQVHWLDAASDELLASLPGIGPRTGARILAEIGDGSAFTNGSKLAAYAGLAPVTRQSGTSLAGESRSRRGNHRLKNAMFLAAFASLRDPASKAFYDRKRAEGKRHNAALICLARRRCDVILAMLRTSQPYQPSRHLGASAAGSMTSTIGPLMQRAGPPTQIIIYTSTGQTWHFAIYHTREIADGRLDIPPAATPATARTAAEALIQHICQRFYHSTPSIAWQPPDDNGMISGQVTTSAPAPRT